MKQRRFDTTLFYLSGRTREDFQNMLSGSPESEGLGNVIPSSWEVLKVGTGEQTGTYYAYAKLELKGSWGNVRMIWREEGGNWKMFETDTIAPEELTEEKKYTESEEEVRRGVDKIMTAISDFDIEKILQLVTGNSRATFVDLLGDERELAQFREESKGMRWEILGISLDENLTTATAELDIIKRNGDKEILKLGLQKVDNVWKMTDSK